MNADSASGWIKVYLATWVVGSSLSLSADELGFDGNQVAIPTVISAARLTQSVLDTPASITVIDRAMIRALGTRELPDILRLVPGMVVGRESGSEAFVGYHGTSADGARRMQVLVDGRSIYEAALARVDWIGLPLDVEDIERIEVVRGPNSATYGANSFFAVVNIITRNVQEVPNAELLVRAGDDHIRDGFARLSLHGLGGDWAWSVFHREDTGFDINARKKTPFKDDKVVDGGYGKGQYTTVNDGLLTLSAGFSRMVAEQARRNDTSIYRELPVATLETGYVGVHWDQPLNSQHRLNLKANINTLNRDEPWYVRIPYLVVSPELTALFAQDKSLANRFADDPVMTCASPDFVTNARLRAVCLRLADRNYTDLRNYTTNQDYREQRVEFEVSDLWLPLPSLRVVLGANLSQSQASSVNFLNGDAENRVSSGFGHAEWRLSDQWLLNVGAAAERDDQSGENFSPRVALSWQLKPNQVLRAIHSRAVRTPDIAESQFNAHYYATTDDRSQSAYDGAFFQSAVADGSAKTERIRSNEISYFAQYQRLPVSLDVRLFRDELDLTRNQLEIDDLIIGGYEYYLMRGAEVSTEWRPSSFQRVQLNYAYLRVNRPSDRGNENTDFVPTHSGSAIWAWYDPNGWRGSLAYGFYNNLNKDLFFDRLDAHVGHVLRVSEKQTLDLGLTAQVRLTRDAELRRDNGVDSPQRIWASVGWRY
ncbi:TonB-dependent receptor plug domain-containing protein [Perlucidibaca aquatica]|uniref:TonB-dependent receptor plug domain-containing protein n=1 Tax=Perlucidibaca aquatica TaxID=1852776 RepID=UPI00083B125E|nr:TonB-dependent receptor [Perlucidibaca aquatica]